MKKITTHILVSLVLITVFSASSGRAASGAEIGAVLNLLVGDVTLKRDGRVIESAAGQQLKENDVFRLGPNSMVEIVITGKDHSIRLTGPVVYRLRKEGFSKNLQSGDMVSRLQRLLARNSEPHAPRTIVSAVRGEEEESEKRNSEGRKLLQEGIDRYQSGNYDEAEKRFAEVKNLGRLKRTTSSLIDFYRAHIHYERMEYREALNLYSKIYRERFSRFEKKEESLSRAIICAYLLGNDSTRDDLVDDYRESYGESGSYWKMISGLK